MKRLVFSSVQAHWRQILHLAAFSHDHGRIRTQ
jgi:hypothetical protein